MNLMKNEIIKFLLKFFKIFIRFKINSHYIREHYMNNGHPRL